MEDYISEAEALSEIYDEKLEESMFFDKWSILKVSIHQKSPPTLRFT